MARLLSRVECSPSDLRILFTSRRRTGASASVSHRKPLTPGAVKGPLARRRIASLSDACRPDCAVGGVARREDQDPRAAQLIDKAVNLAVAPALGDANRLFRRPPFPPPAQRCALICVLSRAIRSGGSAGSATASKMLCQIPCALQRLKRL